MDYAVRLTPCEHAKVTECIQYIVDNCESAVVVEHSPDNGAGKELHYHVHVEGLRITGTSLNRSITRFGFQKGNTGRSVKTQYDKDNPKPIDRGNITYISKGRLEPVRLHNISRDVYDEKCNEWVDFTVKGKRSKPVKETGEPKKKKLTTYGQWEEVMRRLRTIPYKCECSVCKADAQTNLIGGVIWNEYDVHENYTHCCYVIRQVRKEQGLMTDARTRRPFLEMIYTEGHERECDYSEEIREVKKWGWN